MKLKNGISPVVAIALLLVVSVVAVIGFQQWYSNYESIMLSDVEQKNKNSISHIDVEYVSSEGVLYVNNRGNKNITINNLDISSIDCNINQELEPGVNQIDISDCLNDIGNNNVVIVTDFGIIEEEIFIKEFSFLDCSTLKGGEWIKVQGNSDLGTEDFCVMKYEAKNVAGVATSQSSLNPWASITWSQANSNCSDLGAEYHLVTNEEWTTIARQIENDFRNWNSSIVGTGGVYRGNVNLNDGFSCGSNSVLDANTPGVNCLVDSRNMRSLYVGNEMIWDLSGNIDEFLGSQCIFNNPWGVSGWYEWDSTGGSPDMSQEKLAGGPLGNYNSTQGMGRYFGCNADGDRFIRGGSYGMGFGAGIYELTFTGATWLGWPTTGFRCAYSP